MPGEVRHVAGDTVVMNQGIAPVKPEKPCGTPAALQALLGEAVLIPYNQSLEIHDRHCSIA